MGPSCFVEHSYTAYKAINIGGIVGYCTSSSIPTIIENTVNMAKVSFSGSISSSYSLYIGGIVGYIYPIPSSGPKITVRNCANYGPVTNKGTSGTSYIGGIVGRFYSTSPGAFSIQNSINFGAITNSNTKSTSQYVGGIAGYTYYITIENCVSAGKIASNYSTNYIGSFIGYDKYSQFTHCYWDKEAYENSSLFSNSNCSSFDSTTFDLNESVSVGGNKETSLLDALNAYSNYYRLSDFSKWILNRNKNDVKFTINERTSVSFSSKIILLPSLASDGLMWFDGWYTDASCTSQLVSFEVTESKEFYGKWEENTNSYTITFDMRREGATPFEPITAKYLSVVRLPRITLKDGFSIYFWETDHGDRIPWDFTIPAYNLTLYAVWLPTHIKSAEDFIEFSEKVNSGIKYEEMTVFLNSDIDLSGKTFEPIGNNTFAYFLGTFDGQGYAIRNLLVNSTSQYTGLFGYSSGMTLKNVVMDSSCSVANYHTSSSSYEGAQVGGFVGLCISTNGPLIIENSVNMGVISFNGNEKSSIAISGIAGYISTSTYASLVKNCANYGHIIYIGTSGSGYIGGVLGGSDRSYDSHKMIQIQNCLNNGLIELEGTTKNYLYTGGISGGAGWVTIENCVNTGNILGNEESNFVGGITGYLGYSSTSHCYWNKAIDPITFEIEDSTTPENANFDDNFVLNETVSIGNYAGKSLIDALNSCVDYYALRDYSRWVLNRNGKSVKFTTNARSSSLSLDSQIILLPSLASEGHLQFSEWYTDASCESPLTSFEITENMDLHGKWEENDKKFTITFDTRGKTFIEPITAQFGSVVSLPNILPMSDCIVSAWENEYGDKVEWDFTVPAYDITLHGLLQCTYLTSVEDFNDFSRLVNSGELNYLGSTVYLDSDLDFSEELSQQIQPIGTESNYFAGTFDGQGHTISNFVMNSSSEYVGIFGHSDGITVKNVVIDSTCSITSSRVSSSYFDTCIGGIVGHCESWDRPLIIENTVNMAKISFSGSLSDASLYIGGIVGYIYSESESDFYIRNCASYGSITDSGFGSYVHIGGILGKFNMYVYGTCYIQNSFNYGEISTESSDDDFYLSIGGIAGEVDYTVIENCLNAGRISSIKTNNIGSIIGTVAYGRVNILNCFWSSDIKFSASGSTYSKIDNETSQVELNLSTVGKLNEYASNNSWNKWILNTNEASVSFKINDYKGFTVEPQIILLPDLVDNDERRFTGWFNDEELTSSFISNEVTSDKTLYGIFCGSNYTVTFDANRGNELVDKETRIECNGTYGAHPQPTRTGHTFSGWFTEKEGGNKIEPGNKVTHFNNHTLYAHWIPNNYTITFDFNNGTEINDIFPFNASIDYPADMKKEGYTFSGWSPNPERVPEESITVVGQWKINQYMVTFDFNNGTKTNSVLPFNSSINYPSIPTREGHTFNGWSPNPERVPAENITIVAQWISRAEKYAITFNFDNGDDPEVRLLDFNESIVYPKNVQKEGYIFNGWDMIIVFMPSRNLTVTAQWTDKPTPFVEIVFNKVNLSEEEVEVIIKGYTDEEFIIKSFVIDSHTGESTAIIKFTDTTSSIEFIRTINENVRTSDSFVRKVNGVYLDISFSFISSPVALLYSLMP